jgi:hypothetical protein
MIIANCLTCEDINVAVQRATLTRKADADNFH